MRNAYTKLVNPGSLNPKPVTQDKPIPGKNMIKNSEGSYVFQASDWDRLNRFLILGSEGGSFYIKEEKLTKQNAKVVERCLASDYRRTIETICDVSERGRAKSNEPALFALAMAASHKDAIVRSYALSNLSRVARIGTHLFHFAEYVNAMRGWGRALRTAIANWYQSKGVGSLVYQAIKYQQRDGWSHRDLLRLSHPKTPEHVRNSVYKWMVNGTMPVAAEETEQIYSMESLRINKGLSGKRVADIVKQANLPWEAIPSEYLNMPEVWQALLDMKMPMTALIRNLPKLTSLGLLKPMSSNAKAVVAQLENKELAIKARIHPLVALNAQRFYRMGSNRNLTWSPNPAISAALEKLFYNSFEAIEPTGKRTLIALDVSSSMTWNNVAGMEHFLASEIAAVMAMVIARSEKDSYIMGFATNFVDLGITSEMSLDEVQRKVASYTMGGTDISQPMQWAKKNNVGVDTFIIITDNETNSRHSMQPKVALDAYRKATGINAKCVVMAVSSNGFTIADPSDPYMLDVVGCDTSTPQIIAEFSR